MLVEVASASWAPSYGSFGDHFYNEIINLETQLGPLCQVEH